MTPGEYGVPLTRRLLTISLVCLLAGISGLSFAAPKKQDQLVLRVWALPLKEDRSIPQKANWAIVQRFMELHPNIKLEGFRGITAPGLSQEVGPLLAIAGGVAPDVLYVNFRISDSYITQGFLYPLDDYVKQWAKEEDLSKRIYPPVWPVIKRKGHVWAIPFQTYVMAMAYRKDLFREAGLDPERAPKNWDELYEYAQRLTIPDKGQYGMAVFSGPHAAWWFVEFLWSAGGEAVEETADGSWRAVRAMAADTSWAAASMSRLSTNWIVIDVLPSELVEIIESMPAIVSNCFSRGVATDEAIVSGLAPGSDAETEIVGKSTLGRSLTGRLRYAISPNRRMASMSSVVMTGRLINRLAMLMPSEPRFPSAPRFSPEPRFPPGRA